MADDPPLTWPLAPGESDRFGLATLRRAVAAVGAAEAGAQAIGELALLEQPALGLFCSARCPGGAILRALELAHALREAGIPVVSGFHSPVERECLRLLLRGDQPVIICLARDIAHLRIPPEWRGPLAAGRLLLVSVEGGGNARVTTRAAERRNRFAAALSVVALVAYATSGGKTEALATWIAGRGQPLATVDDPSATNLQAMGARAVRPETLAAWWEARARP